MSKLKSNRSFKNVVARPIVAATPAKNTRHRSLSFRHGDTAAFFFVLPLVEIRVAGGAFQRERLDVADRFLGIF